MFSRIQTRYYRSLRGVDQQLGDLQALVGPNASGKTTFLDVIALLSDLVRDRGDVRRTILRRSSTFEKLVWQGPSLEGEQPSSFQIAVEAPIPPQIREKMASDKQDYTHLRYELEVGFYKEENELGINHETLLLRGTPAQQREQRQMFPSTQLPPATIFMPSRKGFKIVMKKTMGGNDNYYTEGAKSYSPSFRLGRTKLALANIPADEASFPVSTWFRDLLDQGVQQVVLNSQTIRTPSPPGLGTRFQTDGSNLPWVVFELKRRHPLKFSAWIDHVRTALEDVVDVDSIEREDDRHRYLVVKYSNGALVPSWLVSDGTLRLLALTIPAYLGEFGGVLLIEEPENGIHPRAIETVIQSLASIYDGQVLIATHSPIALNLIEARQILCFAKDADGATDIVSGDLHPALRTWQEGAPNLGTLFASGILS